MNINANSTKWIAVVMLAASLAGCGKSNKIPSRANAPTPAPTTMTAPQNNLLVQQGPGLACPFAGKYECVPQADGPTRYKKFVVEMKRSPDGREIFSHDNGLNVVDYAADGGIHKDFVGADYSVDCRADALNLHVSDGADWMKLRLTKQNDGQVAANLQGSADKKEQSHSFECSPKS